MTRGEHLNISTDSKQGSLQLNKFVIDVPGHPNRKPFEYVIDKHGCWICTSHRKDKEGYVRCCRPGRKIVLAHRLIFELFNGPIGKDLVCRHTCDRRDCINPRHIVLGTQIDNIKDRDSRRRGVVLSGESHGMAKLKKEDVRAILRDKHSTQRELAKTYGVSQQHIWGIKHRKVWKNVNV